MINKTQDSCVAIRINSNIKKTASKILSQSGLTVSGAFRMMLFRIVQDGGLPFEPINTRKRLPLAPNQETINAIKEAQEGKLTTVKCDESLIESLNKDSK